MLFPIPNTVGPLDFVVGAVHAETDEPKPCDHASDSERHRCHEADVVPVLTGRRRVRHQASGLPDDVVGNPDEYETERETRCDLDSADIGVVRAGHGYFFLSIRRG